jgi:cytochrome oxidase assembly protein ShyY1
MASARGRRVAIVAIAAFVAAACVGLGFWQLQRLSDRRASNAEIERERSREPLPLTSVDTGAEAYTPVRVSGRFDATREVLVYGGTHDGEPGYRLVTPLVLDDGSAILVVRGWVPFRMRSAPVAAAAPPAGELTVHGFVVPDEGDGSTVPDANGVIGRLDIEGIGSRIPSPLSEIAIQLTEQSVSQPYELPIAFGWPELSEGPHLSYAIQWFAFAAIAVVGAVVLLRRGDREATPAAP